MNGQRVNDVMSFIGKRKVAVMEWKDNQSVFFSKHIWETWTKFCCCSENFLKTSIWMCEFLIFYKLFAYTILHPIKTSYKFNKAHLVPIIKNLSWRRGSLLKF